MKLTPLLAVSVLVLSAAPAMAQTAGSETQRDVNQQTRIEKGLQSGQLNTKEAAKLENGEKKIDAVEAKDMKDGTLSDKEKAQIQKMQNKESEAIKDQKHDAQKGNPDSASSKAMQADVARNTEQEKRINEGVKNGTMTNHEAAKMEGQQAKADRAEAKAGKNGRINAKEEGRITRDQNRDSKHIYGKKHNGRNRK